MCGNGVNVKMINFIFNSINRMTCGICLPPVTLDEMFKDCIIHSYSRAWQLGRCVMRARKSHSNVVQAIAKQQNGILLLTGKVNVVIITYLI